MWVINTSTSSGISSRAIAELVVVKKEGPVHKLGCPRRAVETHAPVLVGLCLEVFCVTEHGTASFGSGLDLEVMIAAYAEDAVESLLSKPGVEAVDVVRVTGEAIATVAAMDEEVAAQRAEVLVPPVGVADDDEFHRKESVPLQSGVDTRPCVLL